MPMKKIDATQETVAALAVEKVSEMSPKARFVAVVLKETSEKPAEPTASARQARAGISTVAGSALDTARASARRLVREVATGRVQTTPSRRSSAAEVVTGLSVELGSIHGSPSALPRRRPRFPAVAASYDDRASALSGRRRRCGRRLTRLTKAGKVGRPTGRHARPASGAVVDAARRPIDVVTARGASREAGSVRVHRHDRGHHRQPEGGLRAGLRQLLDAADLRRRHADRDRGDRSAASRTCASPPPSCPPIPATR